MNKQITIPEFNEKYKVKDDITFQYKDETITRKLRWPAEVLAGTEREVVWIEGIEEAINLSDVIF